MAELFTPAVNLVRGGGGEDDPAVGVVLTQISERYHEVLVQFRFKCDLNLQVHRVDFDIRFISQVTWISEHIFMNFDFDSLVFYT